MTSMSIKARNISLRSHFGADRNTAVTQAILYFALYRGDPFGAGTEPTSTGGYARVAKNNDATLWGTIAATDVTVANNGTSGDITFPQATNLYSITAALDYWAVFDNAAGGNLLYAGPLTSTITVTGAGDIPRIPQAGLVISQLG